MSNKIYEDVINGNGKDFTVKEILRATINQNSKEHDEINKKLDNIIRTYPTMRTVIGLFSFCVMLVSALAGYVFYGL